MTFQKASLNKVYFNGFEKAFKLNNNLKLIKKLLKILFSKDGKKSS